MKPIAGQAQIKADPTCCAQELRLSPGSDRGLWKVFTQRNDRMRWVLESSLWMLCGRYNGRGKNQDKESRWKDIAKWQTRHGQDLTQDHGCWNGKRELAIYQEAESIGLSSAKVIRNNQCRYTTCQVLLYTLCIYEFTQSLQNSVNWAPVSTHIYSEETEVWLANSRARV